MTNSVSLYQNHLAPRKSCTGCSACISECSVNAISMVGDSEGFEYPEINDLRCISCGACTKVCPVISGGNSPRSPLQVFAAMNKDKDVRSKSSSGGIFSVLAKSVLASGGAVFGAVWADGCYERVVHRVVESESELPILFGSKYVQSSIGHTFHHTLELLKSGRPVLFSGTPCQIAGLKAYLGKDYAHLLLVEVVCRGNPSPLVFKGHVHQMESRFGSKCTRYEFRSKIHGWRNGSVTVDFSNHQRYDSPSSADVFTTGFCLDLYNRPSCHACLFRNLRSGADISLGDFWRIGMYIDGMDDNIGTSLVLLNTEKGRRLFLELSHLMLLRETTYRIACKINPALVKIYRQSKNRNKFFDMIASPNVDLDRAIAELTKRSFFRKCVIDIQRIVFRIRGKIRLLLNGSL